ncbi:MAG: hypothetical protein WDM79_07980 [Terricaulis sp.]
MLRGLVVAGVMGLSLGLAAANAQSPGALFVSPMGEPFRAHEADVAPISLWIGGADLDADGRITSEEFMSDAARFFARLDTNHNDVATSIESTALYNRLAPEMFSEWDDASRGQSTAERRDSIERPLDDQVRRPRGADPSRQRGAQRFGILNDVEPVMSCDANFDRRVPREEFGACAARRFSLIDVNHDGAFTADEAPQR